MYIYTIPSYSHDPSKQDITRTGWPDISSDSEASHYQVGKKTGTVQKEDEVQRRDGKMLRVAGSDLYGAEIYCR